MVVFTCAHCGESVSKPKVEKHYVSRCRGRTPNLSCMDCFKDFIGTDHEAHTKCISEEQRYSAKGFIPKVNKGEEKQNTWVTMVQSVLSEQKNLPKSVIRIVEEICKHSNTPRKKPKFINFVKNVCGHRTMPNDIDAAWDLISVKLSALRSANQNNREQNGNKSKDNCDAETEHLEGSNADEPTSNGSTAAENVDENGVQETKTKKQRKEEKKRKKYEAELQSVAVLPTEEEEAEAKLSKKDKKKLKKETENGGEPKLHKKRKMTEDGDGEQTTENTDEQVLKRKRKKSKNTEENGVEIAEAADGINDESRKGKLTEEINGTEEVGNLHEQNVASDEPKKDKTEKFDWHATILSLLQKKGNEMPFKRLQKKVLAEYAEATGRLADDRIVDKLCKKLKSAPNVKVDKNRVLLVE